jgi:hypothetical protein
VLLRRTTVSALKDWVPAALPASGPLGFAVLTVAFEFLAEHYLFGNSWEKLLADYNIAQGDIWLIVLVMILISPILATGFWEICC